MADLLLPGAIPRILLGVAIGVVSFMILLAVLVPVLRHERRASLPKGFLGVALSFALLTLGVVIVYIVSADGILALLAGELIGFLACWALLAVRCMGGSDWL